MDKARDVKRRGASRFKNSKPKLSSGLVAGGVGEGFADFSEKSRREKKLRKLSSVVEKKYSSSNGNWEMEDNLGIKREEDDNNGTIRFNLSDNNGVAHASVPRRLRSAMKKRSCDSISPCLSDSKKLKSHMSGGTNSTKADGTRKSKSNMKQGGSHKFSRQIVHGPITKDEEEVAETLYALAKMFCKSDAKDGFEGKQESLEPIPSEVPESNPSCSLAVEERNGSTLMAAEIAEAAVPSSSAEILPETDKVESLNELNLSNAKKLHFPPDDIIPSINQPTLSLNTKTETQPGSVKFSILSEHLDAGLKQAQQNEASFLERKPGTSTGMVTPIRGQMEPSNKVEPEKTGLALWPGLSSTANSRDDSVEDLCLPSSTSKLPAWLDVAYSSHQNRPVQYNFAKASTIIADKKSPKRSTTHVYISRLIQTLRMTQNKETTIAPSYGSLSQRVLPAIHNFNGVVNGLNGVVSTSSIESAVAKQSPNGVKDVVLQQNLHQDQPQLAAASAVSNWQKQSFDFFMSSARSSGIEVNDGLGRARNKLEPPSPFQNPYLPSFVQHQFGSTYSLPQPCYNSSAPACSDQFSSAQQVQMQLPSYSIPYYSAQASPTTLAKQQQRQHQHQHQQLQRLLGAHYRTDDTLKTTVQFLSLPNRSPAQRLQQQQLMPVASQFSPGQVVRQDNRLPSVYEEHGGGFHTSALPLQLLCNERL